MTVPEPVPSILPTRRPPFATSRRRLLVDRTARWVTVAGGLAIIASILGILVFIAAEVLPLADRATVRPAALRPSAGLLAVLVDEHRSHLLGVTAAGEIVARRLADDAIVYRSAVLAGQGAEAVDAAAPPPDRITGAQPLPDGRGFAVATTGGRVIVAPATFAVTFAGDRRVVTPSVGEPIELRLDPADAAIGAFAARLDEDGGAVAAAALASGEIAVAGHTVSEDFAGEVQVSRTHSVTRIAQAAAALAVDAAGSTVYVGSRTGELLRIAITDGDLGAVEVVSAGTSAVTALALLIGDRSLVVGQADGAISVWFPTARGDQPARLTRIRDFPPLPGAVARLAPSLRDKGFLAVAPSGDAGLYFSTSHRTMWTGKVPVAPVSALVFAPKGDAAYLVGGGAGSGRLAELEIHNPHPEVSLRMLFGKGWFEGYDEPAYVWQSTGGTDDFEPKLSLVPLLVGTLKGTFYSLLLAIPLGIFGAMYLSQFMHPTYKRVVKPLIEIMASLPSVVLGFLAGLWLAPRVEQAVSGILLMLVVLPLVVLLAGGAWSLLPRRLRGRFASGTEVFVFLVALALGIWLCLELSPAVERLAFGGSFPQWLRAATGLTYDQRNAVVVGLAMGFAVIPILFAIAEDAFSNVPRNLVAGSLALGANRWQTVTRVVLPTASPGIFSAVMVGFGRAIGETMIVLMATGNTPIMDWNPFDGFRTLSANIAVEIPEAPVDGTLYRTLFLAALLLFALTFAVNTAAELVRQRLRERYSQL